MSKKVFKRHELKYIITINQMNDLLLLINKNMRKDNFFNCTIRNIYYDTPTYLLIRTSIEKPEYKEKLRIRSYKTIKNNEDVFIELKKKYKKIVYKRREILPYDEARFFLDKKIISNNLQITNEITYALNYYKDLKPMMFLSYDRIAFVDNIDSEFRLTFDSNILWRDYDLDLTKEPYGNSILANDLVLMEVKTVTGLPRWLLDFLGTNKIYKQSFSKYGNAYRQMYNKEKEEKEYA